MGPPQDLWAMLRADGVQVSCSSVARAMKRRELLLPVRDLKERRAFAEARKAAFAEVPRRRNRVWQMDFTEFETTFGWTALPCCVVDYASKYSPGRARLGDRQGTRRGLGPQGGHRPRRGPAVPLPAGRLLFDLETCEVCRLRVVTDNGAAFKSDSFWRFVQAHPCLEHIRTRHYAPETNGVVERFNRSLKYEHLYQREIADAAELAEEVGSFLATYNEIRPHESLGQRQPNGVHRGDHHLFGASTLQEG